MAVYTKVTDKDLAAHLAHFSIGEAKSLAGIPDGVENTNYLLTTGKGKFILTLFEKRTGPEELPFCISFMQHLHAKGIPCPEVVESRNGEQTLILKNRPALITTFIEGGWLRERNASHAAATGGMLARMHVAAEDFPMRQDNTLSLPAWRSLIDGSDERSDEVREGLAPLLRRELAYLERNWPDHMRTGAIHGDLFPDNVFFKDGNISGVIDFYFSCTYPFIYDLMLTFNAWCFNDGGKLDAKKAAAFLEAYQKERKLTPAELKAVNFFGRAAATRIIATRLYDWLHPVATALLQPKDPLEYADILNFYHAEGLQL